MKVNDLVKRIENTVKLVGAGVVLYALVFNSKSKTKTIEQYMEAALEK